MGSVFRVLISIKNKIWKRTSVAAKRVSSRWEHEKEVHIHIRSEFWNFYHSGHDFWALISRWNTIPIKCMQISFQYSTLLTLCNLISQKYKRNDRWQNISGRLIFKKPGFTTNNERRHTGEPPPSRYHSYPFVHLQTRKKREHRFFSNKKWSVGNGRSNKPCSRVISVRIFLTLLLIKRCNKVWQGIGALLTWTILLFYNLPILILFHKTCNHGEIRSIQGPEVFMNLMHKSSKTGRQEVIVPPIDAEALYRTYLRLRAERELSGSTRTETDYLSPELKKAIDNGTFS